ncbi:MAG: DUF3857 domain-containing protein [bacterium]|nr:DUF3857 domain-containing protein [bacterium]
MFASFYPIRRRIGVLFLLTALSAHAFAAGMGETIWRSYLSQGDLDAALGGFEKALKEHPDDALAQAGYAYLSESRSGAEQSFTHFLDALDAGKDDPEATLYLFEAYQRASGREDRETLLKRLDPLLNNASAPVHFASHARWIQGRLLQRLGRWDEAESAFDRLGFITDFWVCGPFDNAEKRGHAQTFGPEENLDLAAQYPGRRRQVGWQPISLQPYDGYIELHSQVSPSQESTVYLAAQVTSDATRSARLLVGYAGAIKVWVNGEIALDNNRYHSAIPDQSAANVELRPGANVLLLKASGGETGKFGVYVRLIDDDGQPLKADPLDSGQPFDFSKFAKVSSSSIEGDSLTHEPTVIRQMKALGENLAQEPFRAFFYVRLIELLDVLDENDQTANALMGQLCKGFPGNTLLLRNLGATEPQPNRQRLAYSLVLEKDPNDLAAFLKLLDYYKDSPYATKGFDLIRDWKKHDDVPLSAEIAKARMLNREGLPEAAAELLARHEDELDADARYLLLQTMGGTLTQDQRIERLKTILNDDATHSDALHALRRIAMQDGDKDLLNETLKHERRMAPFSIAGLLELAANQQARGRYDESIATLQKALTIAPEDFQALRMTAIAYNLTGKRDEALGALAAAQTILPSDPWCLEYQKFLQPDDSNYASPYLRDWKEVEIPDSLDLSKANHLVLMHQEIVKVFPNGNSSRTVHEAVKILTDNGIRMQQVRGVYYEAGSEDVVVKRARVWKPGGTVYDAPAPVKRSASSASDADSKLYQDYMVAALQFPALEKGSVLELEYEVVSKKDNIYADYFGDQFFIGDGFFEPTVETEYILISPASREFYYKFIEPHYPRSIVQAGAPELKPDPEETIGGAERVWHWTFHSLPAIPREPLMPASSEILPYIKISTFKTWTEMMDWYWNLSKDQLKPGPVVKDRLEFLLQEYRRKRGIPVEHELTKWEKVRAVNEYVNTGIRYLGLEFGIHGYKPHKVDEICNAQYGDCKDKAALAVAMLGELGIDARMVILRTTDRGEFDYDLPMLGMFNHAIYYLPDLDGKEMWIDGTATFFDASELPPGDRGANSLIVVPGGDGFFKRIPYSSADDNGGVYTTRLTIDENGDAQGVRASEFRGLYNPIVRRTYENQTKAKEVVDQIMAGQYPGSESSNIQLSDLDDYSTSESLTYEMKIPQFGGKHGGRMIFPSTFFGDDLSQRYAQLSNREYDLVLSYPWSRTNILQLNLPDSFSSVELPADRDLETEFGSYQRKTTRENGVIEIRETLIFKPVRVAREKYADFREFCRLVDLYQDENVNANL